jgi:uncharacterized iron-regulated membrane protein
MGRPLFVRLHRWVGLFMALFLVIEGMTGAMLAFRGQLTHFFDPGLYSRPGVPYARPLDLATLVERSEQWEPTAKFHWFLPMGDDGVALVGMVPRHDAAAGGEAHEGMMYIALDPWTGREVRRMDGGLYSKGIVPNVMPFVYELHKDLALGGAGAWILCTTALLWTIDCFAGAYLTIPLTLARFWPRWKPAWLIRTRARPPRVNLDIHRSFSLWLWLVLLLFAWSSVALVDNLSVYSAVTARLFGPASISAARPPAARTGPPRLDWHQALERGLALAAQAGALGGYDIGEPNGFWYTEDRVYTLRVDTSRRFPEYRYLIVAFDGDSGAALKPWGLPDGNVNMTVTDWLVGFHMITEPFEYDTYRVLVVLFGLALCAISITGVFAWQFKRRGRRFHAKGNVPVSAPS